MKYVFEFFRRTKNFDVIFSYVNIESMPTSVEFSVSPYNTYIYYNIIYEFMMLLSNFSFQLLPMHTILYYIFFCIYILINKVKIKTIQPLYSMWWSFATC